MEYLIGALLGLGVCGLVTVAGFERDRAAYPIMLIVIASYYWLFGVLGGDMRALAVEIGVSLVFLAAAIIGFRTNLWVVVVGLLGHAALDAAHGHVVANPGVPEWWPVFCGSIDAVAGAYLAWRLIAKGIDGSDHLSFAKRIRPHINHELAGAETPNGQETLRELPSSRAGPRPRAIIDSPACARTLGNALMGASPSCAA